MRTRNWRLMPTLGALVLALLMIPGAVAQCGLSNKFVKPSSWTPQMSGAHLMRAALEGFNGDGDSDDPTIVGMWHVVFTAHTVNGGPIPSPGAVIDNSIVQWHSDGTEIMNSARPAQDGNFCLGVWEKTGRNKYYLNHIPWLGNDTTNAPSGIGNPQGGAQITEQVTLSEDGKSYTGTFTLTAYNTDGSVAIKFTGSLWATRITTSTPFSSLL